MADPLWVAETVGVHVHGEADESCREPVLPGAWHGSLTAPSLRQGAGSFRTLSVLPSDLFTSPQCFPPSQ